MERYRFDDIEFSFMEASCIPFAVYQFIDKRVVTLVISEGLRELLGCEREEAYRLMDNDMYRDAHPDDVARIADAAFRFATEGGRYDVVYRTRCKTEWHIVHAIGEHVHMADGSRLAYVWYTDEGVFQPEVEGFENGLERAFSRALKNETHYKRSYYDQLTGLPNMTYFFELAEAGRLRMLEEGKKPALLFFNLKGMKFFNYKHGFGEGDELLKAVSKVLVNHYSNESCGRIGKDNFAAFTDADGLEGTLRQVFAECAAIDNGKSLPIRAGIYLDEMGSVDIGTACDRAYYACTFHRDAYISGFRYFDEEMLESVRHRQYIIDNLDRAIEERWIRVFYQPIVRAASGKVCDEEALVRWFDPDLGLIMPADFIPILEDAKLAYKVDLFVLEQVLQKMKRQAEEGLHVVPQSINLSRTDFDAVDIVEEVRRRVDESGLTRDKLTIEITETVVGRDFDFMKAQIDRFRALGFSVWMDDFGNGYSSLDMLQDVHFDLIKLNMRFMERFNEGDKTRIIMTELVKMAIALGIDTIAEGVETAEQAQFLKEIGCGRLQGFYFCKAIPLEMIVERNRTGTQIGFENPMESGYYAELGKINLYDASVIVRDEDESLARYFDTIPMAIIEVNGDDARIVRSNRSYREYFEEAFGEILFGGSFNLVPNADGSNTEFHEALKHCAETGDTVVLNDVNSTAAVVHAQIKRVAKNPVTGTVALVIAVLAVE